MARLIGTADCPGRLLLEEESVHRRVHLNEDAADEAKP